ncbi:MAG: universal stress protein [Burkholderiaceae bacterium]|nr:universal stress protein [Burkholderiaceae bacterium]
MNEIKSILLHLDASLSTAQRLHAARRLASAHSARLEVMYAVTPALLQYPMAAVTTDSQLAAMLATFDTETRQRVRAEFDRECARSGPLDITWCEAQGDPIHAFARRAYEVDLLLLGQLDPDDHLGPQVPDDFAASVLIETGKPGLLLPYIHTGPDVGKTVLVAWKDSAASARAVTAALPLLQRASAVHVASWQESDGLIGEHRLPVEAFLSHHGIAATVHRCGLPTAPVGELLLSMLTDLQADLLVTGCYGHSRAREWLLGGVTRTLFDSMTVPVLMAH